MNLRDTSPRWLSDERGESGVGLLIVAPAIGMLILMSVMGGRIGGAQTAVEAAAGVAAREATLARSSGQAHANARASAQMTLEQADFTCTSQSVSLDAAALNNAPGIPGSVTATITCAVPLSDLGLPVAPGTWTITAQAKSPVDTYRERG